MATLSEALTAYRICAKAEGKSARTIQWITSSVRYFGEFVGDERQSATITTNDLRRFINALRDIHKYRDHPYNRAQGQKLSESSINTYARAIRAFFGYLEREEFIDHNPMARVKMPKVPVMMVSTTRNYNTQVLPTVAHLISQKGLATLNTAPVTSSHRLASTAQEGGCHPQEEEAASLMLTARRGPGIIAPERPTTKAVPRMRKRLAPTILV